MISVVVLCLTLFLGLQKQAQPQLKCPRVAIGYNANLDLVVNAIEVLQKLSIATY